MSKDQKNGGGSRKYEEAGTSPFIKLVLVLVAVAIVLVAGYSILSTTGSLKRLATAYTVGEEKISAMEMNIHYYDVRSNFLNEAGYYLQLSGYSLDATLDLQPYLNDSTMTFGDYFRQSAQTQARQVAVLTQEAKAAGYADDAGVQAKVDAYMASMEKNAADYDLSLNAYVSAVYGAGTKPSDVRDLYEKRYYAAGYYDVKYAGFEVTDSEIEDYYQENKNSYDQVDYYLYSAKYTNYTYTEGSEPAEGQPTSAEEATTMTEAAKADAQAKADAILAAVTDADSFDAAVKANAEDDTFETGLVTGLALTATTDRVTWLADEARAAGDKDIIEDTTNHAFDVVLFVKRYKDDAQAATVRHILLTTETSATDATDEEVAAVAEANAAQKAALEAIYEEWKAGDATEESFAALATAHTEDPGSSANGGLYEHFGEGTMVTAFNDWAFDPARKYGDTGIVETDYGYHLMYFVSADGDYVPFSITDTLKTTAYDAWYAEVEPNYAASASNFGMNMVGA